MFIVYFFLIFQQYYVEFAGLPKHTLLAQKALSYLILTAVLDHPAVYTSSDGGLSLKPLRIVKFGVVCHSGYLLVDAIAWDAAAKQCCLIEAINNLFD